MIATVEYLTELFWECNKKYFDNSLPTPYIELFDSVNKIARFEYYKNKKGSKKPIKNQIIKFTKNYDFDKNTIRDIMVHEMIHYYIAWNRIKDNKAHGKQFMKMAEEYNQKYGLSIKVTIDVSPFLINKETSKKIPWYLRLFT